MNRGSGGKRFLAIGPQSYNHIQKRLESRKGYFHSEETKQKIGEKSKGRLKSEESKRKTKESGLARNWHPSEEHKKIISLTHKGKCHTGEKNPMYGKKQPTVTCENCGRVMMKTNYIRWHGNNCKLGGV